MRDHPVTERVELACEVDREPLGEAAGELQPDRDHRDDANGPRRAFGPRQGRRLRTRDDWERAGLSLELGDALRGLARHRRHQAVSSTIAASTAVRSTTPICMPPSTTRSGRSLLTTSDRSSWTMVAASTSPEYSAS